MNSYTLPRSRPPFQKASMLHAEGVTPGEAIKLLDDCVLNIVERLNAEIDKINQKNAELELQIHDLEKRIKKLRGGQ